MVGAFFVCAWGDDAEPLRRFENVNTDQRYVL